MLGNADLRYYLYRLIQNSFRREEVFLFGLQYRTGFFTSEEPKKCSLWTCQIVTEALVYLLDNIYFRFILGNPKPKKMLVFRFVGIFEYIILLMLILFLDMCPNSYGWMPSL